MNRLVIKLNAVTENVTVGLISKLYSTAKTIKDYEELNDVLDSQVELLGNLLVVHAYGSDVTYLEAKFPNLHINVTGGTYVKFVDPLVQSILLSNNVGDGVGCTLLDLYNINSLSGDVFGGSSITSFNEFQYFNPAILLLANLFGSCSSLTEITLPVGTTLIGSGWFGNCSNLVTINNTQSITSITGLGGCSSLVSLNTPALTNVGNWGCQNCTSLTTIDLSHCTSIGRNAFQGCTSLDNIDLSSCTSIGQQAFKGCTSLTTVGSLPADVGAEAFEGCTSLVSVDFSNTTSFMGTFLNCSSLGLNQDLDMNLDGKSCGSNSFRNTGYKTITLHETTEHKITRFAGSGQGDAFGAHMVNLQKFDLSDTKQTGSTGSLYSNTMTTLIYPETQTSLSLNGRDYGTALLYIICLSRDLGDISQNTYWEWAGTPSSCAIYVQDDILNTYLLMPGWQVQYNAGRVKAISELPSTVTWYTKEHPST